MIWPYYNQSFWKKKSEFWFLDKKFIFPTEFNKKSITNQPNLPSQKKIIIIIIIRKKKLHTHIWVCMKSMIYVCNLYSQVTLQKFRLIGVWGLSDFGCLGLRNLGRSVLIWYSHDIWDWKGVKLIDVWVWLQCLGLRRHW